MPNSSPGNGSAWTLGDLGLPPRAVTALARAGVSSIEDLAALSRRDLAAINGLGPGMIAAIRLVVPEPDKESPAAAEIPSFDSLRAVQRHTAVDVLVPGPPPTRPAADPVAAAAPAPAPGPRPAEYGDLLRLGARLARAAAAVPVRLVRWSVREPARCLRRLAGG
jgi:Bacterial RNA polymerase, alpha chain C terminal domain